MAKHPCLQFRWLEQVKTDLIRDIEVDNLAAWSKKVFERLLSNLTKKHRFIKKVSR